MRLKSMIAGVIVIAITAVSIFAATRSMESFASLGGYMIQSGAAIQSGGAVLSGGAFANSGPGVQSGGGYSNYISTPDYNEIPVSIAVVDYSQYMYFGGQFKYITNLDFYSARKVTFSSSNPDVITVDAQGNATVLSNGETCISAVDDRGNVSKLIQKVELTSVNPGIPASAYEKKPIYKMVNDRTGEIVYTIEDLEIDALIASMDGWRIGEYMGDSGSPGDIPVYRLINKSTGKIGFTTDQAKYAELVRGEWIGQGVVFFVTNRENRWEIT